ncbi:MAG: carbohydrate-binding family 9-like protein [Opitutaceae bacterium]|nr:carbohydrate-binding family 9-like protein [Opitutaceae bacterium]
MRTFIATVMGSLLLSAPLTFAGAAKNENTPASAPLSARDDQKTASDGLPRVSVPKVTQAVSLDGKGGDPAWNKAVKIELGDFWSKPDTIKTQATQVSLLHDGEKLYIAFDCADVDIQATRQEHDGQTFRDDCVEIFLGAPIERLADAACLEINALGTVADYYYRHADWINYRFESRARIAVSRTRFDGDDGKEMTGYRVEVGIEFSAFLPVLNFFAGEEASSLSTGNMPVRIRANFARWDRGQRDAGGERFSIWSDPLFPFAHPHRPERYGWLVLEK